MQIPLVNLRRHHKKIEKEFFKRLQTTFKKGDYILGSPVKEFEDNFSKIIDAKYTAGCSSGTSALELSLRALGISKGDEVITSDLTFFATIEAIYAVGAKPILADICPNTYGINLSTIKKVFTKKTKAIIPVHLYGNVSYMSEIEKFCKENNLFLIQDAAQAHLAMYNGRNIGKIGDLSCFSFYPGKNLGAVGDAGCVSGKSRKTLERVKFLRDHGRSSKYVHEEFALSARMDSFQAIILDIKLKGLKKVTQRRKEVAKIYDNHFRDFGFESIICDKKGSCVYHLYPVLVRDRNVVLEKLKSLGIGAGVHYPVNMSNQPGFFKIYGKNNSSSYSSEVAKHTISLPICGEITDREVKYVAKNFLEIAKPFRLR